MNDPSTGRFVKGNRAYRRRVVKKLAHGISTLNPSACEEWLRPFVAEGAPFALDLLDRVKGDPVLARLVGDAADAHCVYRALIALAAAGDLNALKEARGWLREFRACMSTLSALAGISPPSEEDDPHARVAAILNADNDS